MHHPVATYLALRYTASKRKVRFASFVTIASVLGVSLGVAVLLIVASVMNGFEKEITRHVVGITAHAVVFRPGEQTAEWQVAHDTIRSQPSVAGVSPYIRGGAMLNHKGVVRGVTVQGISISDEAAVSTLLDAIKPDIVSDLESNPRGVVLGASLASSLKVIAGQKVTLITPRWDAERGLELPEYSTLEVIGIFKVGMHDFDANFALMNLRGAADAFAFGDAVSGFRIRFNDRAIAPQGAVEIATRVGAGYAAINWTQYHRNFFLALKSQKRIMFVILSIIVAVAAFNIVASLVMIVKEKERDIAILRTIGLRRRQIMLTFMVQGILIGIVGIVLGLILGIAGSVHANRVVNTAEQFFGIEFIKPDVYYIDYLAVDIQRNDMLLIAFTAFVICVIATIYPAWRAASAEPANALRYE